MKLCCEAAVQASLDSALEDLSRAAVANPVESASASCSRIDEVFDRRMMAHQHLAWAQAEAAASKPTSKGNGGLSVTGTVVPLPLKGHATPALAHLNIAATALMAEGRAATLSAARIDAILIRLFQQHAEITAVIAELAARPPSGQSEIDTLNTALTVEAYRALAKIEYFIQKAQNFAST